jgi:hypothetical protein
MTIDKYTYNEDLLTYKDFETLSNAAQVTNFGTLKVINGKSSMDDINMKDFLHARSEAYKQAAFIMFNVPAEEQTTLKFKTVLKMIEKIKSEDIFGWIQEEDSAKNLMKAEVAS